MPHIFLYFCDNPNTKNTYMSNMNFFAVFKVDYLYYIPQFLPVAKEMQKRNLNFLFILAERKKRDIIPTLDLAIETCEKYNIKYQIGESVDKPYTANYLISGANSFPETYIKYDKSVLIVHGVGTKSGYFTEEQNKYDIRFIEGEFRYNKIKELYPDYNGVLANVGFSKLDDVLNMSENEKKHLFEELGLDVNKKTILYAPTFYPSSIEKMSKDFPKHFSEYNIIIKPHYFSYLREKYKGQRKRLEHWAKASNVYVAGIKDFNLAPFFAISDLMISDESSAIFEFAALDKPVICNRFLHLRWTYRIFKSKLSKKFDANMNQFRDIGQNVESYKELKDFVVSEFKNPRNKQDIRHKYTKQVIGTTDGNVSVRMLDILEK